MAESVHKIIALKRLLFRIPRAATSPLTLLVFIFIFSFLGNESFDKSEFFLFLFLPVSVNSIGLRPMCRYLGGDLKTEHAFFLSLFSLILLTVPLKIADLMPTASLPVTLAMIFTVLNFLFLINLLVFSTVAGLRIYKAVLPSSLFPFFSLLILSVFVPVSGTELMNLIFSLFMTYIIVWVFFFTIGLPLKKTRINLFDLVTLVLVEHIGELKQPRNPFRNTGEKTDVLYQALSIEQEQVRHLMTVPWLHPGPLGSIGGNLPAELRHHLNQKFQNVTFLHTYVDHTLDPIFMDDVIQNIEELTDKLFSESVLIDTATKVFRIHQDGITLHGLRAGNIYVLFSSFAPDMTEDISPDIGKEILSKYRDNILLIDCHNSVGFWGMEAESMRPEDDKAHLLVKAVDSMRDMLSSAQSFPIQAGMAGCEVEIPGIRHISVLVFRIDNQTSAFVTLDANNLLPGLRESACENLKSLDINQCEILTTDSHLGQEAMRMFGKVGTVGRDALIKIIVDQAKKAQGKIGPAKLRYGFGRFEAKVLGHIFEKLMQTSDKIRFLSKTAAILMLGAVIVSAYVLLW